MHDLNSHIVVTQWPSLFAAAHEYWQRDSHSRQQQNQDHEQQEDHLLEYYS
jgi:hypothetical protein